MRVPVFAGVTIALCGIAAFGAVIFQLQMAVDDLSKQLVHISSDLRALRSNDGGAATAAHSKAEATEQPASQASWLPAATRFAMPASAPSTVAAASADPTSFASSIEDRAEGQYWYQRNEKSQQIHPAFTRYTPVWPCIWGEELTGIATGEGSKWTCGIRRLAQPCTVYSFGSRGDIGFERGVQELGMKCDTHIYDPTVGEPPDVAKYGLVFHQVGLGTADGKEKLANGAGTLPVLTLKSAMKENGHTHIDVLKVDIDYMEHKVLTQLEKDGWPSVGMLLLEVHIDGQPQYDGKSLDDLFRRVELANFRLFHSEANWEYGGTCCIEYSFIQKNWQPDQKSYSMVTAASFKDVKLGWYPMNKRLVEKYITR